MDYPGIFMLEVCVAADVCTEKRLTHCIRVVYGRVTPKDREPPKGKEVPGEGVR